jgi:hypothetical protein
MRDNDTPPQIRAANAARVRVLAEAAARDDVKLRRAINVVRAALYLELLTVDELTDDERLTA